MFVRVWQYRAKPESEAVFTEVYGPHGAWARLFAHGAGYLGTELNRVIGADHEYRTVDRWRSRADWEAFRASHAAAYERLDRETEALTERETAISEYEEPAS